MKNTELYIMALEWDLSPPSPPQALLPVIGIVSAFYTERRKTKGEGREK
jgi:hypothetical protein